jgi:hypothetical protein
VLFRNKDWEYLGAMEALMPSKAKGSHIFCASQAVATADGIDSDLYGGDDSGPDDSVPGRPDSPLWDMEKEGYMPKSQEDNEKALEDDVEKSQEDEDRNTSLVSHHSYFFTSAQRKCLGVYAR